jgi:hypothetical protein
MYTLCNKTGNVFKNVRTEKDRDYYLKLGYTEVVDTKLQKNTEGVAKKNGNGKRKAKPQGNI